MDPWQQVILTRNRPQLVKNINVKDGLYTELRSVNVIFQRQEDEWRGKAEDRQVELLLDYLLKRPSADFYGFCMALNRDNQKHIVDNYLRQLGVLPSSRQDSGTSTTSWTSGLGDIHLPTLISTSEENSDETLVKGLNDPSSSTASSPYMTESSTAFSGSPMTVRSTASGPYLTKTEIHTAAVNPVSIISSPSNESMGNSSETLVDIPGGHSRGDDGQLQPNNEGNLIGFPQLKRQHSISWTSLGPEDIHLSLFKSPSEENTVETLVNGLNAPSSSIASGHYKRRNSTASSGSHITVRSLAASSYMTRKSTTSLGSYMTGNSSASSPNITGSSSASSGSYITVRSTASGPYLMKTDEHTAAVNPVSTVSSPSHESMGNSSEILVDIPDRHSRGDDGQLQPNNEGNVIDEGNGNQDGSRPCICTGKQAALIAIIVVILFVVVITVSSIALTKAQSETSWFHGGSCKSSPCLNGGICSDSGLTFNCRCPENTTGPLCEHMVKCNDIKQPHLEPSNISGIYGDHVHVNCEKGFMFRYGTVKKSMFCKHNEKWTPDLEHLQCIADTSLTTVTQSTRYSSQTQHPKTEQQLSPTKPSAKEEISTPTEDHYPTKNDATVTTQSSSYSEKNDATVQHGTKMMAAILTDQPALPKKETTVANPFTNKTTVLTITDSNGITVGNPSTDKSSVSTITEANGTTQAIRTTEEFTTETTFTSPSYLATYNETVTSYDKYVSDKMKTTPKPQS